MKPLNIVFAGTPEFGLPCLEALYRSSHCLKAVYTQPDRPAGRGRQLQASAVKAWACAHEVPVYQPLGFKEEATRAGLKALSPDVLIVIAYGLILPEAVLSIPTYGAINVHASLLPAWRGASPIQHAIWYGDKETGVSIMQMDKGMDTGAVITTASCAIGPKDTSASLQQRLAMLSVAPLLDTLAILSQNQAQAASMPQDHSKATYARKILKEDARIDWQQSAHVIHNTVRAFLPWPVAFTQIAEQTVRIYESEVVLEKPQQPPGTIVRIDKSGPYVACADYLLQIRKLQFPGSKILSAADCFNTGRLRPFYHQVCT